MPIRSRGYCIVPSARSMSRSPLCPPGLPACPQADLAARQGDVVQDDHQVVIRQLIERLGRLHRSAAQIHDTSSASAAARVPVYRRQASPGHRAPGPSKFARATRSNSDSFEIHAELRRNPVEHFEPDIVPRGNIFAPGIAKSDDELHCSCQLPVASCQCNSTCLSHWQLATDNWQLPLLLFRLRRRRLFVLAACGR